MTSDQLAAIDAMDLTGENFFAVITSYSIHYTKLYETLHRISAIRNRRGEVIGLTLRVGRAVFGTIDLIRDLVEAGKSTLLLGLV